MTGVDRRLALGLYLLVALTYGYFFNGGGGNPAANFNLTRAIVERHTIAIDEFYRGTGDIAYSEGRLYSNKSPGLGILGVAVYAPLYWIENAAGLDPDSFRVMTINAWLCTFVLCGLLGAAIAPGLYWYGRMVAGASRSDSLLVALAIALGTPLFPYASVLFAHVTTAALIFLAFLLTIDRPAAAAAGRRAWRVLKIVLAGLLAGLAAMSNYLCIPVVLILALFLSYPFRRSNGIRVLAFLAGTILPLAGLAFYQWAAFGSPWRTPIETMDPTYIDPGAAYGIFYGPSLEALWGITFSRYRGLFYYAPILVFAIAGAIVRLRRRERLGELILIGSIAVVFLGFNITFNGWRGGDAIGPRYLIPIIPFLGILLCDAIAAAPRLRVWRRVFVSLAVLSVILNFTITAVDPQPAEAIRDPVGTYILPLFLRGSPSVALQLPEYGSVGNREGFVSVNPDSMTGQFSLWSSFNLGELIFGQGSRASLLVIVLWILGGSLYLFRFAAREDARLHEP